MPVHDNLGTRMKEYYEERAKYKLIRRMPVAIRIDGRAFHTFTRSFDKPFDKVLMSAMQSTMWYLCQNVQGCVLGYTQSDEITLILTDYKKLTSDAFFDNEVQKICSICASMATLAFNRYFEKEVNYFVENEQGKPNYDELVKAYNKSIDKGAMFDARCFNIPKEEVTNLLLWRQLDATRNSIQMVGQANFSHKELQGKSCSQIQEMLWSQKGINWDKYPISFKRGACCTRDNSGGWFIDLSIPRFVEEGRHYVEDEINFNEEVTSNDEK